MAYNTFGPGLALDRVTMRGLPVQPAQINDAETGDLVEAFTLGDTPDPIVLATNAYGYFPQFQTADTHRRLVMTFGNVSLELAASEIPIEAYDAAKAAQAAAEAAQAAAEAAADLVGAPADSVMAAIVEGLETATRSALDGIYGVAATTSTPGQMSAADKLKLNGVNVPITLPSGAHDLNDYTVTHNYHQPLTAGAAAGTNYPIAIAGNLQVFTSGSMTFQTYTTYNATTGNRKYWRGRYNSSWGAWQSAVRAGDMEEILGYSNVKDYGATGDGTTDDIAAFVAAIGTGSRRVYVPPGTYRISTAVKLPSKTHLVGASMDLTTLKLTTGATHGDWVVTNSDRPGGNNNILVSDMTLDWDVARLGGGEPVGTAGSQSSCLTFGNVQYGWVRRVRSINCGLHGFDVTCAAVDYPYTGDGTWGADPSRYVYIEDCESSNFGDDGFTTHHSEHIWITNCRADTPRKLTNNNAFEVDDGSRHVTLTNNYSEGCYAGVEIKAHEDSSAPYNVTINGHVDVGSVRAYNFRHIGHHTATDPNSTTAHDIVANNLVSINPNNDAGFQDEATPRALAISAYKNVVINGFTAIGRGDYTSGDCAVAVQFKARNVDLNGLNISGWTGADQDVYIIGGDNQADYVTIRGMNTRASAIRAVSYGTGVHGAILGINAEGPAGGGLHGLDLIEAIEVQGATITGYTNIVRADSTNYASFPEYLNRANSKPLPTPVGLTTMKDLTTPGGFWYLSTSEFTTMGTDRPAGASGGFFVNNSEASGGILVQTITRNSTATIQRYYRILNTGTGSASLWQAFDLTSTAYAT